MKVLTTILSMIVLTWCASAMAATAPVFPPVTVTGPFPKGTELLRHDAPVDSARPSSPVIYHEYTCYKIKNPPIIDGNIDNDSIWNKIPWTLMTFWEEKASERTFTVFSNDTSGSWKGPKDCTAWFKLLWDESKVYCAVKVYNDVFNPVVDSSALNNIYQHDCIQLSFNSTPPHLDAPPDPYMGCELGFALGAIFPLDSAGNPVTTGPADTVELFTYWQPDASNSAMSLSTGDNNGDNSSTKGKAIHIKVEKTPNYYITNYEFALDISDTVLGYLWSPYIHDDVIGRFSIMAMDADTTNILEDVTWASGILNKNLNNFGSIKWSQVSPDGISYPTKAKEIPATIFGSNNPNTFYVTSKGIEYSIAQKDKIQVAVFDLSGKKIVELVNREQAPGAYLVQLKELPMPKGAYFYRLKTRSSELTRKIIIVK
jgi:hypothetical protein